MDCKRCGAPLNQGVVLCPECGARQRRRAGAVRCASCHRTIPLGLTVCPHCGRNARPAGPRWGWWIAGFLAIVLVSLWGLDKLPIARAVQEVRGVRERLSEWVQVLGPVSTPTSAPGAPTATPPLVALVVETPTPTETPPSPTQAPEATAGEVAEAPTDSEEPDATPTAEATGVSQQALATGQPTTTPTPEPTATATATTLPSPTATQAPPTATATKPAASGTTTYRVQSGDTLSSIATRFGITWEALASANGLTSNSVLRIGQELIVPAPGGSLPPTATARPRPTATPAPPTPTPQPQLAAPVLVNPGDQASYTGGEALIELSWQQVPGMVAENQYQVVVRWVEQGAPQVWDQGRTTWNSIRVPPWLWNRADQPARQYTWYVRVVQVTTDGRGGEVLIPLSPPSQSRVFYWN